MTLDEIDDKAALMRAAGRTTIPVPIEEWRSMMATKVRGTIRDGKFSPKKEAPHFAQNKKAKADRIEKGLRANRARKKGAHADHK